MKRKYLALSLLTFCFSSVWGQIQKPIQEQLWEGFQKSLQQDILQKQEKDKKMKEDRENEYFQNGIKELKLILSNLHSKRNIQSAKDKIAQLKTNVQQTIERKEILTTYNQLLSEYESHVRNFLSIFNGEITNSDFERYRKKIETLSLPKLQTLSSILKAHYDKNGLDRMSFPEDYVYLNTKLIELKKGFIDLGKISDRAKFLNRLESIVKIESEISEEHKTYHALK